MTIRLRRSLVPILTATLISAWPAAADETTPLPCPADAEKQLVTQLVSVQGGQADTINTAYSFASAAREQCADNSLVLGLATEILVNIASTLSQSGSGQAAGVWKQALAAASEQDAAPVHDDVSVSWENGTAITLTDADARSSIDGMLETHIAKTLAAYSMERQMEGAYITDAPAACPYPSSDGARAVHEAKGLVGGIIEFARGMSYYDGVLARLDQLQGVCTGQALPLIEENARAHMELATVIGQDWDEAEGSCIAGEGKALIGKYRTLAGDTPDEGTANVLAKLTAWEHQLDLYTQVSCKR